MQSQVFKRYINKVSLMGFSKLSKPLFFKDLSLKETDKELHSLINSETERQWVGLELIASENYASKAVLQTMGSILTNKYSEGQPGARYYGGNEFIDKIENLAKKRSLEAFGLNPDKWEVNVQALSGSPANFSVYTAVLQPGEKMMGLHLYSGGHLTHGFKTADKKISASAYYFDTDFYYIDPKTGVVDYDDLKKRVLEFKPKLLICGASAYTRDWDYKLFREAADSVGALLMADIAHIAGLVAAKEHNSPFDYCDIVTSTTHKSLRGPRSGLIFANKERHPDLKEKINFAVFPMLHGGPHNHQIAAVAAQMKEVSSPEFKEYAIQVKKNSKALAANLMKQGQTLIGNGTDNHLMLWDVRPFKLNGQLLEKGLEKVHITVNKNTIIGDKNALKPGGIRLGTCALTSRGMVEKDMESVASFLTRFIKISEEIVVANNLIKTFVPAIAADKRIHELEKEVKEFSTQFRIPGVDNYDF